MQSVTLNKAQKEAVTHTDGPLMIIAGAGTGKTTVITERIKYILENELAKPSEILALTFTEKAAQEMEERIDIALPLGYGDMWVSTFHSFCDRILRQEGLAIGIDTNYNLLTSAETTKLIADNLFEFDLKYFRPLGNPNKFIGGLKGHFSRLQDEDITSHEYLTWAEKQQVSLGDKSEEEKLECEKWLELARAYVHYEEIKIREGVMDFGDLIAKTLILFRTRKNILSEYQKKFKYILVDEFQDTNIAQNELVTLLSQDDSNITVVLDDDQSIYRFRGAAVSNAIQFRDNFPKLRVITLVENYRSGQRILDTSYKLITHNNPDRLEVVESIDKKLRSQITDKGTVEFIHSATAENEAQSVIDEIAKLHAEGYSYKDVAILVRANSHAEPFVQALNHAGIPHQFLGPAKLFEQPEIYQLIAYLKVLVDISDSLSFYTVLTMESLGIDSKDLNVITNAANKKHIPLFEYCHTHLEEVEVSTETIESIRSIVTLFIRHLTLSQSESVGRLIYLFLEEQGKFDAYLNPTTEKEQAEVENIALLFDKLKSFEGNHKDAGVREVVEWIDLLINEGESPRAADVDWSESDMVSILTVHSSKGLEFPICFLVNLVALRFPSMNRGEQIPIPLELVKENLPTGEFHIQEERRLAYVGMTRAKDKLYLTAADFYGDAKRAKKISQFVYEALEGEETIDIQTVLKSNNSNVQTATLEKDDTFIGKRIAVDYLSYTQIQTFQTCPLHYKLKYLIKIPTETKAALTFGNVIHTVMKRIYVARQNNEELGKKDIIDVYNEVWVNEGFDHKKHEQDMKEKGRVYLEEYYEKSYKRGVTPVWIEHPFDVYLTDKNEKGRRLKIAGKIDRVDYSPQTGIEIVDYKTGENVPSQKEVDNNEQLTFYALAVSKLSDSLFVDVLPENITLSLYYFEGQQKISTKRSQKQLRDFESKLFEIRKEIEESDFKCSNNYFCNECEYKMYCKTSN